MIPWRKFQYDDEPTYSDNVYHPTASILANQVPILAHQILLLNAPPLENADDRRFVVSQLSPEQRERHFIAFPPMHTSRTQLAIDTLVNYFEHHEEKPLSSYDRNGRPDENRQRSYFERMRKLDERGEVVFTGPGSYIADDLSDHSADLETDCEAYYDFEGSLPGLILDSSNVIFDLEALHKPEPLLVPELSLSPSSTCAPPSPNIAPLDDLIQHSDLPSSSSSLPSLPSLTTTAATYSSLLPTTASHVATSIPALSIANLIHHTLLSATSTTSTDPEVSHMVSTVLDDIATRQMSNAIPFSPLKRTVKETRMRRSSRPRGNKDVRRGSNSALEKAELEAEGERERERIQLRNRSIGGNEQERQGGQFQLSKSYPTPFGCPQYIEMEPPGAPFQPQVKTNTDGYAAGQLPIAAIKYEPPNEPGRSQFHPHTEHGPAVSLKRKQREDNTAEQSPHHRPFPYSRASPGTTSQWQPPYHLSSTRFTNARNRYHSSPNTTPRPHHPS